MVLQVRNHSVNEIPDMEVLLTSIPSFNEVRYIKLGSQGRWEKECLENGIARIGFKTEAPEVFRLCQEGNWTRLRELWLSWGHAEATATRYTNETKIFFEDMGERLWITFIGENLYWGTLEGPVHQNPDGDGSFRKVARGWKGRDTNGEPLTKDRLSGALIKLATYRGTSCDVDVSSYVIRRINGQALPEVQNAQDTVSALERSCINLMQLLTWQPV